MPTLGWRGKDAVLNHHLEVPYRLLKCEGDLSAGAPGSGNLIVEGDNLQALKALLPYYKGQVKCIYIDPPYNTGNEGWVYNDNVNSPEIKAWLHEVVGKEGEDLNRHDKWLCMMWPRLKLLREFLTDEGVIWVSIDDNEAHSLKLLMDEVFLPGNFVTSFISEKMFRALDRAMKGKTFQNADELNAFLEQFKGVNIDQLAASQAMTPEEEAMERVDAAMEAATQEEALDLLREALDLDPRCCEARVQLAHVESRSSGDLLPRLEAAIADEEARLGKAFFAENKGHFWGVHQTHPYMRACLSRAWSLLEMGQLEAAQMALSAMIRLNPHDNQGVRLILGPLCLRRGELKAYRVLRNKFKRSHDLELLWGDVLEALLLGDPDLALSRKAPARKANGHMEAYLLGHKRLPKRMPPSYFLGTPEEAACSALTLIPAWAAHPQALAWLKRTR